MELNDLSTSVCNIIEAYRAGKKSIKWVGGMLEFISNSEDKKDQEKRKEWLLEAIEKCGKDLEKEIMEELERRNLL